MATKALTEQTPRLLTFFGDLVVYTEYNEGTWTKRNLRFGNGKQGKPARFNTAWSRPDGFLKRYNSDDWKKSIIVEANAQSNSFIDSNGTEYQPRLMPDGYTVDGEEVYKSSTEGKSVFDSLGTPKIKAQAAWFMAAFTTDELDILYDLVREKHDDVMRGDWEAVRSEIGDLHLLMAKIIRLQDKAT